MAPSLLENSQFLEFIHIILIQNIFTSEEKEIRHFTTIYIYTFILYLS